MEKYLNKVTCGDCLEILKELPDNSVDLIYACHLLEHFGRWEMHEVLQEWYRVLKTGGLLRLAVPDFSALIGFITFMASIIKSVSPTLIWSPFFEKGGAPGSDCI